MSFVIVVHSSWKYWRATGSPAAAAVPDRPAPAAAAAAVPPIPFSTLRREIAVPSRSNIYVPFHHTY
jgi:hypothetical protein